MDFFVSSLITSMRETLEALFVFVAVFSIILKTTNDKRIYFAPLLGMTLGIITAIGAGIGIHYLGNDFSDQKWFKITFDSMMVLSTGWFIIWMIFTSKENGIEVKDKMMSTSSLATTSFLMVFISFFREGMETVAFTYEQTSIWGILAGCFIAIATALVLFAFFKYFRVKYLMFVLMVLLILATSSIVGSMADHIVEDKHIVYSIPNDTTGMQVVNSFLRGLFGIKTSATVIGLSLQITWDIYLISLLVWKEFKRV